MLSKIRSSSNYQELTKAGKKSLVVIALFKILSTELSAQSTNQKPNVTREPQNTVQNREKRNNTKTASETKKLTSKELIQIADINTEVLNLILLEYQNNPEFLLHSKQRGKIRNYLRNNIEELDDNIIIEYAKIFHNKDLIELQGSTTLTLAKYLLESYWPNGNFYDSYKMLYSKYISFDKYVKIKTTENSFTHQEIKTRGSVLNILPQYAQKSDIPIVKDLAQKAPDIFNIQEVEKMFNIDSDMLEFLMSENIASNWFNNDIIAMLLETKYMKEVDSLSNQEIQYFYGMLPDAHFYFGVEDSFDKESYKKWIKNKNRILPSRKDDAKYNFSTMFPTFPSLVGQISKKIEEIIPSPEIVTVDKMYKGKYEKVGDMTQCTGTARRFMTKNDPEIKQAIQEEKIICRNSANGPEGMLANIENPDPKVIGNIYSKYYNYLDNNKKNNSKIRAALQKGEEVEVKRTINTSSRLIVPEGFETTGSLFGLQDTEGNLVYIGYGALGYINSTGGTHHGHASGLVVMQDPKTGEHKLYINENYYNRANFESKIIPFIDRYQNTQDYKKDSDKRDRCKFVLIKSSKKFSITGKEWTPPKKDTKEK